MDYFNAVRTGRVRVKHSLELLQEFAGPSFPVLFLKMGVSDWTPVGEEELVAVVKGGEGRAAVVVCDSEGNSKAMSSWLVLAEAERVSERLKSRGLLAYVGEVKLPV